MGFCSGWVGGGFLLSGSPEEAVLWESKEFPHPRGASSERPLARPLVCQEHGLASAVPQVKFKTVLHSFSIFSNYYPPEDLLLT